MEARLLTQLEMVRQRPGMYIGDTDDTTGALNMLLEVFANSFDQYLAGRCTRIAVEVAADGAITIADDGPGLSADGGDGVPPLVELLARRSTRATVDGHRPHVHLSQGVGLFVVNALSERLTLRSVRDGVEVRAVCARGHVVEPVQTAPTRDPRGTRVCFRPDPEIFLHPRVPRAALACRLEELGFLAPRLVLSWTIAGDDTAARGLPARVALATPCAVADVAHHVETYETPTGPIDVDVALAWRTRDADAKREPEVASFVNFDPTRSHGTHVDGVRDAVQAFLDVPATTALRGMVAAVSVILADVKYGTPDKSRLTTAEARAPVATATTVALTEWARRRPELAAELRARVAAE